MRDDEDPLVDAGFHDGVARPLRLWATDAEDLQIVSALCQDAVLQAADMRWLREDRTVVLLLNRFRWEFGSRTPERVRTLFTTSDVRHVRGQGIVPGDEDTVLSLLAVEWEVGEDAEGILRLTFAGDGVVEIQADCLDVTLRDVTRPYAAPSGKAPVHPE
ncbi:MAG: DUF2948 family protein [Pseudomonadota bacterium]